VTSPQKGENWTILKIYQKKNYTPPNTTKSTTTITVVSYQYNNEIGFICVKEEDTGYFTSDNEPGGIENATRNTFAKL
jgi:hypothetical protein